MSAYLWVHYPWILYRANQSPYAWGFGIQVFCDEDGITDFQFNFWRWVLRWYPAFDGGYPDWDS